MKRVSAGKRYEEESVRVWMPRVRSVRRDSSVGGVRGGDGMG